MSRSRFWIILILALVVIAGLGMWYKNKVSENMNLAPAVESNSADNPGGCKCPVMVGTNLGKMDGGTAYVSTLSSDDCGSVNAPFCSTKSCKFTYTILDKDENIINSDLTSSSKCVPS